MQRSYGKTKVILLSRNYFKFRLVKVIIRKIAYKSIITTKNVYFLRMDHQNVVREIYQRSQGMYCASETCLNRSESSIAPTPERFAVVFVQILTNSQNGCPHEKFFLHNLFKVHDFIKLVQKIQVKCRFWLQKVVEMCKVYSKTSSIILQVISIEYFIKNFFNFFFMVILLI